ncbi:MULTISPECIES: hypothetical protein [unclassified Psychrobacter]|uniref:hypothetical protein n=1 Tax=unclassified Psychrobacter TaxID=196806 RepID=UPI0040383681
MIVKTVLRILILFSSVFLYSNSYAQSFETESAESVRHFENSKAMNNAIFGIFKNEPPRYCRRLQLSLSLFVTQSHTSVMIVKALFDRLARALLSA